MKYPNISRHIEHDELLGHFMLSTHDRHLLAQWRTDINKRIHPHLFRHQILTYLTGKGIVDAKIQLISGHKSRDSLSICQDLSLADINKEYWEVMKDFPIQ